MLKTALTVFIFLVLGLLLSDSIGFYQRSLKYLLIDSRIFLIIFLIINITLIFFEKFQIPASLIKTNKIIFPFLFLLTIFLILGNFYLYATFSLNNFFIDTKNFIFVTLLSGSLLYLNLASQQNFTNKLKLLVPPLLVIIIIFIEYFAKDLFYYLDKEDGVFETIQFLGYLSSAILTLGFSLKLFSKKLKTQAILFLLLGIFLIFITGEEVSWGQRFFGFQTPEKIAQNNLQKETTIHNNKSVQPLTYYLYMIIGLYGSFSYLLPKLLPKKKRQQIQLFITPPTLFFYFFPAFAFFFLSLYISTYYSLFTFETTSLDPWQELSELFLSLGFLQFILSRKIN